jgi:hypothetical protein
VLGTGQQTQRRQLLAARPVLADDIAALLEFSAGKRMIAPTARVIVHPPARSPTCCVDARVP